MNKTQRIGWLVVSGLVVWTTAVTVFAQLPGGTWQYHWGDDFSGDTLDSSKWSHNYPWGTTHNHDAVMSPNNVVLGDGTLTLVAERTGVGGDFTSGTVSTGYNRATFNGGYVEARILLPDTPGSWPAFWGLYTGWPPENDIMEYPIDTAAGNGYGQDQYHTAYHYSTGSGNAAGAGQVNPGGVGDLGGTYHSFGMEWREDDWVGYYFNGSLVQQFGNDSAIAQMQHMYLILNYAVGGWPGRPNTAEWPVGHTDEMKVDYVRVWKQAAASSSDWVNPGASTNVSWDSAAAWTGGVPNLGGVTSSFGTVGPVEQNVDWSGRRTLSVMNLDGSTRYRFGGAGDRLVLGYGNNGAIHAGINVAATSTVTHEVQADLEFAGGLNVTNDSNQPLVLAGAVLGGGNLEVNGPGVVSFDGNNSFRGTMILDSGTQGPAIARARGQHAFGLGGAVVIGQSGNSTTARMELENNSLVSNPITFNGRTNASPAIVNNSGDNIMTGRLTLQTGGSQYRVRSDLGRLTLTGDSPVAGGVAVRAQAAGARTLTLEGAGDGLVSGAIEDGNAQVSLVKTGAGTWSLAGENTYSGTTAISGGTLVVDGTTGHGATTLTGGAMLAGSGTVRGNLVAQSGTAVRVGASGLPYVRPYTPVDDFESYALGDLRDVASPPWTAHGDTGFADIETDAGNQALTYGWQNGERGASRSLDADVAIADGEVATFFFRINSKTSTPYHSIGLGDQTSTESVDFDDFETQLRLRTVRGSSGFGLDARSGGAFTSTLATDLAVDAWHNIWMVVDQGTDTYDLYLSSGDADATAADKLNTTPLSFRNGTADALDSVLGLARITNLDNGVRIDDVTRMPGIALANPLSADDVIASESLDVLGDFTLPAGAALQIDLGDGAYDRLNVLGTASLQGALEITLEPGFVPAGNETFTVLTAGSLTSSLTLAGPDGDKFRLLSGTANDIVLIALGGLPGDFTGDGVVNGADFLAWQRGNSPNSASAADLAIWQAGYGIATSVAFAAAVPEPNTLILVGMTMLASGCRRCRRRFPVDGFWQARRISVRNEPWRLLAERRL